MPAAAAQNVDPCRCPLCGQPNACAMASSPAAAAGGPAGQSCWCMSVPFPESLLARVPAPARRRACICARCAAQASEQQPA